MSFWVMLIIFWVQELLKDIMDKPNFAKFMFCSVFEL